jgi:hypothetical protein
VLLGCAVGDRSMNVGFLPVGCVDLELCHSYLWRTSSTEQKVYMPIPEKNDEIKKMPQGKFSVFSKKYCNM